MKRLLVIDGLNLLFRNYIVNPSLSTNGQPIGGLKGFSNLSKSLSERQSQTKLLFVGMVRAAHKGASQKIKVIKKAESQFVLIATFATFQKMKKSQTRFGNKRDL